MKAKPDMQRTCLTILGVDAESNPQVWQQVKVYEQAFGSQQVALAFEEWAFEVVGDLRGKPIASFLKVAATRMKALVDRVEASAAPVQAAKELACDLSYYGEGRIVFNEKAKATLAELLRDYSHEEIVAGFKHFYDNILNKDNERNFDFAAKNFVETADQPIMLARRAKRDAAPHAALLASIEEGMAKEAEEGRRKRALAQAEEFFETELPS